MKLDIWDWNCIGTLLLGVSLLFVPLMIGIVHKKAQNVKERRRVRKLPHHNGNLVGYKALIWNGEVWCSPLMGTPWNGGEIIAPAAPIKESNYGVYVMKTIEDCKHYAKREGGAIWKVGMYAPVEEFEKGFLAAGAYQIERVKNV